MRPYFKDKVISNQDRDVSERIKSENKGRSLILHQGLSAWLRCLFISPEENGKAESHSYPLSQRKAFSINTVLPDFNWDTQGQAPAQLRMSLSLPP